MIYRLIFMFSFFMISVPAYAQKAGVGAWENSDYTTLDWIEQTPALGWYYNWRPDQIYSKGRQRRFVEFVPMIHGSKDVGKRIQSDLPVSSLLGFNEPDGGGDHQAGLSVERAVHLWPQLERRNLRLGSPATTRGGTLGAGSWQRRFMDSVEANGLRVDFMAVHYYSTNGSVDEFKNWLVDVHREYRRPIWVTEFAYIDWDRPHSVSYAENAEFASAAIEMMEGLPFVERHAWFAANPYKWGGRVLKTNLVDDDLRNTVIGSAFDRALGAAASSAVSNLQD